MKVLSILLFIALAVSCKSKKETATTNEVVKMTEKNISLKTCYTQKEIQGEESMPPYQYLVLASNPSELSAVFDSIQYADITYKLKKIGSQFKTNINAFASAKSAIVYYTQDGIPYFSKVDKIEIKEDIYLPTLNPEEEH